MSVPAADLSRLRRRGFWLEGMSMAWTVAVAAVAITAGILAESVALIGLGLESVLDLLAAAVVIWHLRGIGKGRQARAVAMIAAAFLAGGAYLLAESIHQLASHTTSGHSEADLGVAVAALVSLPVLAFAKRRAGRTLSSAVLLFDAADTAMGSLAAAAALIGVGLNAWLGWWWADHVAGLAIGVFAIADAIRIWRHRR